ncbi:MAG: Uma2 family endonuclease [Oscillatoriales cyanobacterium RU_3_3]|nr:Uma2 family endonuclease [Microcoleus sp. SU_5_6]NJL67713.1 Uma2 family endonuclease [Microcoleus sp. SM1_3_4]NJM63108.1 Uma2 family endonuclease [Oscillatoriales cyanobacterium RU_3_3]NJR24933.1 Uma2 family endonuclease [Richelia sp. CSU_2_1]
MVTATIISDNLALEESVTEPPDNMELVDGKLVEKNGMTLKTGKIQLRLARYWGDYKDSSGQGGEAYVEVPCRTSQQIRRPDVAYLTPELVAQFGNLATLPQSFPLIAEIVSPTDIAEDVFLKAQEYLASSCQEVWLVFPESCLIFVMTQERIVTFRSGDTASTQQILLGCSIEVDRLLA